MEIQTERDRERGMGGGETQTGREGEGGSGISDSMVSAFLQHAPKLLLFICLPLLSCPVLYCPVPSSLVLSSLSFTCFCSARSRDLDIGNMRYHMM